MKITVKGIGRVTLDRSDFRASGGEGSVYVKESVAYKIYDDPLRTIPEGKIVELSPIDHPDVIRPQRLVLTGSTPVGYTMRALDASAIPLCQLFPLAFKKRKGVGIEAIATLVSSFRATVAAVHSHGSLVVDLNEMNFLLSPGLDRVYFVDVDSYQTASYPATALMESVRDRHSTEFSQATDWFSFAVVTFQMFTGIHPYKGSYPPLQSTVDKGERLDARMRANISVLNPQVSIPAACLPASVIPGNYLDWYEAVLERGERVAPPLGPGSPALVALPAAVRPRRDLGSLRIAELWAHPEDVVDFVGGYVQTLRGVYRDGELVAEMQPGARLALTPGLAQPIAAWIDGRRLRLRDLTRGKDIPIELIVDDLAVADGAVVCTSGSSLVAVRFVETSVRIVAGVKQIGNVHPRATLLRDGVAMQNLFGAWYASLLSSAGTCRQIRIPELDGYRVVDARLSRGVLVIIGERKGCYDRLVLRVSAEATRGYDLRIASDVTYAGISMAVLDSGVVLLLDEAEGLEVFHAAPGSTALERRTDSPLDGDARLFAWGAQALFATGPKLCTVSARS